MLDVVYSYLWKWWVRPIYKWILRQMTKLCELQRICYGEAKGGPRTLPVELSLRQSNNDLIQKLLKKLDAMADQGKITALTCPDLIEYAVITVVKVKCIKPELHNQFLISFRECVTQMYSYKNLVHLIEKQRTCFYDSENQEHENKLLELWSLLKPNEPLEDRVTRQWGDIGFQGDDPKTDFRGMGILGLDNLIYFARRYPEAARHVLSHSHHPQYGYSFAIVGINLTSMAYKLLRQGLLKSHFYNTCQNAMLDLNHFHQVYSYLYFEFDKFWLEQKPRDIMEFNRIRDLFETKISAALADPTTVFKVKIAIETL